MATRRYPADILDNSISQIRGEQANLTACLARSPGNAADLQPLLDIAHELMQIALPGPDPAACAAGKVSMLERLAEKTQAQASLRLIQKGRWQLSTLLETVRRPWGRQVNLPLGLAAVLALLIAAAGLLLLCQQAFTPARHTATVAEIQGHVQLSLPGSDTWQPGANGQIVAAGTRIRTGRDAAATLIFFDGSVTTLGPETELVIKQLGASGESGPSIVLHQRSGCTRSHVPALLGEHAHFEVETSIAVIAVREAEVVVTVWPGDMASVAVVTGQVDVASPGATVSLLAGQNLTLTSCSSEPVPPAPSLRQTPGYAWTPPPTQPEWLPTSTPRPTETVPQPTPGPAQTLPILPTEAPSRLTPAPTQLPTNVPTQAPTPPPVPTRPPLPTQVPTPPPVPTHRPTSVSRHRP